MWRGSLLFKRYVLYSICTLWSEAQKISQANSLSCHKRFRSGCVTCKGFARSERIVNLALASRFKILPLGEVHEILLSRLTCREHIPLSFAYRILFNLAALSIVLSVFSLEKQAIKSRLMWCDQSFPHRMSYKNDTHTCILHTILISHQSYRWETKEDAKAAEQKLQHSVVRLWKPLMQNRCPWV